MRKMSILVLLACFIGTAFGAWGTNTVVRPNGGNGWAPGLVKPIRWSHTKKDTVKIELWKGGNKFLTINNFANENVPVSPATYSQYLWTIPANLPAGDDYRVKICNYQDSTKGKDASNANFAIISNPKVNLTAPDGGDVLLKDRPTTITWTSNLTDSVIIELLKTGAHSRTIDTVKASSESYTWQVPADIGAALDYKIRIKHHETDSATVYDVSYDFVEIKDIPYSITAPNTSGIKWLKGATQNITWTSSSATDSLYLTLLKADVALTAPDTIRRKAISGAVNTYAWKIPTTLANATTYKVQIKGKTNTTNIDESNYTFSVYDSLLLDSASLYPTTLTFTNKYRYIKRDSTFTIKWFNTANIPASDSVKIELYKGGTLDRTIARVLATPVSYEWSVPALLATGNDYTVKISSIKDPTIFTNTSKAFTVSDPPIEITSPNGGEFLMTGTDANITFKTTTSAGAQYKIELWKNGVLSRKLTAAADTTFGAVGSLTYTFTPRTTDTEDNDYKIKIISVSNPNVSDISSANFSIFAARLVTVSTPSAAGISLKRGSKYTINWTQNFGEDVTIELLRNGVVQGSALATVKANIGMYVWTIPSNQDEGYTYKIRITNKDFPLITDESDFNFKIIESSIRVTSFDGGTKVTWLKGETHDITWVSTDVPEDVKIQYLVNGTGDPVTIVASTPNNNVGANGSIPNSFLSKYSWTIPAGLAPGTDTLSYIVRISSVIDPTTKKDDSDSSFNIANPSGITVAMHETAGLKIYKGNELNITWTDNIKDSVNIGLMKEVSPPTVPKKYKRYAWIKKGTSSDGSYKWNVPTTLADGLDYKIQVQSAVLADSGTVRDSSTYPVQVLSAPLIVIKPNSNDKMNGSVWTSNLGYWTKDSTVVIKYSVNATITGNLKFEILQGIKSTSVYTYPTVVPAGAVGIKTLSLKIPTTVPASDTCRVRISSTTPVAVDISDSTFAIKYAWKGADIADNVIKEFKLEQNYPNPFNNSTEIIYSVPTGYNDNVKISIYNVKGEIVSRLVNKIHTGGRHFVNFNASAVVSGVYYYVIEGKNFKDTKRMLLLK